MGRGVSSTAKNIALLPATTIGAAVTASVSDTFSTRGSTYLLIESKFLYGAGGTDAKFWVQTRVYGGTWRDIANFAYTTSAATKWSCVKDNIAVAAVIAASDAALTDNTILDGFIGDEVRVKWTTTGTYSGATSITITATSK